MIKSYEQEDEQGDQGNPFTAQECRGQIFDAQEMVAGREGNSAETSIRRKNRVALLCTVGEGADAPAAGICISDEENRGCDQIGLDSEVVGGRIKEADGAGKVRRNGERSG